jgi:hypothetical protein
MDTRIAITENELLAALTVTTDAPDNAKTVRELVKETGLPKNRIKQALFQFQDEERLIVHQVLRVGLDGRPRPVPAYAVLAK